MSEEFEEIDAEKRKLMRWASQDGAEIKRLQAENAALRNFGRLLWAYYDAQWAGTREHGEMLDEGRKLGVVD